MQAGAYQNATWVVGVAKAGVEEGIHQIGGSCIVAPTGEIVARAVSEDDELVVADCDLDLGRYLRAGTFDFARHRRIEHYRLISERTGIEPPPA
jgi:predicted amidohydrolase